jgi:LysR family transcriptional regulator, transcriptional activator of nhaA
MDWLNYHHLHYFWMVAREGNLTRAAQKLRLSPSTVSTQVKLLESALDQQLFHRQGRRLVLTDAGRTVLGYADQIFSLGAELRGTLARGLDGTPAPLHLRVGVADILPKLIAWRLLEPALGLEQDVHLVCREDSPERLVADLAVHEVDVVISDTPVGLARGVRAHTHPLGSDTVSLYATPKLAARLRRAWPDSLAGTPILLQAEGTTMRHGLDTWFADRSLRPLIVGEFEDSALLKAFGRAGVGCFAMPTMLEEELVSRYGVEPVGLLEGVEERFFAITMSRKPENPALRRVLEAAGESLGRAAKPPT